MYIYVVLNIIVLLFMFISNYRKIKNPEFMYYPLFVLFFLVAGFRDSSVGADTSVYVNVYESIGLYDIPKFSEFFSSRFEVGFIVFNKILYTISTSYIFMLASYAFVTLFLYFYVIKKQSKDIFLSIFLFFAFMVYIYSLSNIRQSLAIALIMLSYHFFTKGRNWRAILSILLATCFHTSALIFLLVFFVRRIYLKRWMIILISLACIPLYFMINSIMVYVVGYSEKYQGYLETEWFTAGNKLGLILKFVIVILIFLLGEIILKNTKLSLKENFLRNIVFIGVVFSFFNMNTALIGRFTMYFTTFILLYIPFIISKIKKDSYRIVVTMFILVFFMLYLYSILIFRPDWNSVVPYKNVGYNYIVEFLDSIRIPWLM